MLTNLLIKNYVLIDHLEMNLSSGLNTITGETGAGKSIMLGAVGLLLGNRADTKSLLLSDKKCVIEGQFNIEGYGLETLFAREDLDYSNQSIIRREISPSGKSRAFVNDTPVLLDILKQIGEQLLDVHSQHDTLLLSTDSFQLKLIDAAAGNEQKLIEYKQAYKNFKESQRNYDTLLTHSRELQQEYDYHVFLLEEISRIRPSELDLDSLESEQEILENAEEIKQNLSQATDLIDGNEMSVSALLSEIKNLLKKISPFSKQLNSFHQRSESLFIELMDLKSEIEAEGEQVEFDPERSEDLNHTLGEVYRLLKKHNLADIKQLADFEKNLAEKVDRVANLDDELEKAKQKLDQSLTELKKIGKELSDSRKGIFDWISSNIELLLSQLSIPEGKLEIDHEYLEEPVSSGFDQIKFLFSANRGVPVQELKKVASGGEFSRLMFAFKYLMAGKTTLPTFIFDEIDNGVSGEIARQLGLMMKKMGENQQVITITHLPQVAAYGSRHYFVYKEMNNGGTASRIRELSTEERINEIAKMISGDHPSEAAIESARELISSY